MKLTFPAALRPHGLYIAGNPGSGKTSLIQNLALEDIKKGLGVCVIDPTAGLVNRLVNWIPKERVNDTIYFDTDDPLPIDFFSYRHPAERRVLTDQLVDLFQLEGAPISKPRLERLIGTLFDANENRGNCTFMDILYFLESKKRQKEILDFVPHRKQQWEFMPSPKDLSPIVERMTKFDENPALKKIFSHPKPPLNIWDVMQENKVLLINLNDSPSDLFIGSLICAKFQQATFGRRYIPEPERTPYYLYIDECNTIMKYAAPQFDSILLRARQFKLCLTMTNQLPSKLPSEIQDSLGTIGSLVLFNLKTKDGNIFKDQILPRFTPQNLVNLEPFHAIVRIGNQVSRVRTPKYLGFSPASYAPTILKRTVDRYSCGIPTKCFNEGDGNNPPAPKTEQIQPGPAPDVPPHERKKKNP